MINKKKFFKCYEKRANQGDRYAQHCLGYCYDEGIGVEMNLEEAFKWFEESANQGNLDAQYYLAIRRNRN